MKFELNKTWHLLFYLVGGFIVISILAFLFIAFMYRINDFWLFSWIIPNGAEGETPTATPTNSAETIRNFAWLFWMFLSLSGAGLGLWLAWQGRQIHRDQWQTQHESHLQERYEKATDMLSSGIELARIGGCRSLVDLGKADESMKSRCMRLLFASIDNPILEIDRGDDNKIIFPIDDFLRPDIQSAIDSFSALYEYYGMVGIDDEIVKLPSYFWENQLKGRVSLIKANLKWEYLEAAYLKEANLQGSNLVEATLNGADLSYANLQDANLEGAESHETELVGANLARANLQYIALVKSDLLGANLLGASLQGANLWGVNLRNANLQGTKLQGAIISNAKMQEAKNLTKEQILSAKWGYARNESVGPPQLPEEFMQDEDIKKWLETPAYDRREPEDSQ